MISYFNIADVKIRYESVDNITDKAALFFKADPFEKIDLEIFEDRCGRLLIPQNFVMTYEHEDSLNCFVSPEGEIIIQMGLNHITDRRDGSYRARLNSDMSFAEIDYTPFLSDDGISGILGRFIYECHIVNRGRLPLHAVSVETGNGAILFSGVSGAGKSTQADLWIKYASSNIINGDRAVLIPHENGYITAGTAWSGTSEIYTNLCEKVKAIVFLEQAEENRIEKLTRFEAFNNIIQQCAIPYYHTGLLNKFFDTIDNIIATIPMYYLKNKADEECYNLTRSAIFES